nr:MAG: hypothetical protein DIU78_02470 [Pseudomonadota bacterium]
MIPVGRSERESTDDSPFDSAVSTGIGASGQAGDTNVPGGGHSQKTHVSHFLRAVNSRLGLPRCSVTIRVARARHFMRCARLACAELIDIVIRAATSGNLRRNREGPLEIECLAVRQHG